MVLYVGMDALTRCMVQRSAVGGYGAHDGQSDVNLDAVNAHY